MSTAAAAYYRLRDLIERLDRALDGGDVGRALGDAAAFLHQLRFGNGDNAMSDSPTFVAVFDDGTVDGTVTRMTVYQSSAKLDFGRGVRLARWAYRSRKRTDHVPSIKAAHYEDGETGAVLVTLTGKDIAAEERFACSKEDPLLRR